MGTVGQRCREARRVMARQLLFGFARPDEQQPRIGGRRRRHLRLLERPAKDAVIEVVAAERGVAVGGKHLEHAARELEDRDVERPTAEVVHGVRSFGSVVEAIGDSSGSGLIQ